MRSLTTALALAALPLAAHAQVRIQPRPVQAPKVAIAIDREPALYVYDDYSFDGTTRKTLHYVNDISGADHKKEATYGFQHITADRRGNVYVAVYVGTSEQSKVVQLGKPGWFNGPLKRATAVATDAQGRIYITDADLGQVIRIDDISGANMVTLGSFGSGVGQFRYPQGITIDRAGKIYIADTGNNRIVRVDDMNGEGWRTYDGAAYGARALQVTGVRSIAVDSKGRLYYLRPANGQLVRVDDIGGANVANWGRLAEGAGLAIDDQDRIYLADAGVGKLFRLDDIAGTGLKELLAADGSKIARRPHSIAWTHVRPAKTIIR